MNYFEKLIVGLVMSFLFLWIGYLFGLGFHFAGWLFKKEKVEEK